MAEEKTPTVEDILRQRRMNITDLESSGDNTIREILLLINPVEISRLCATSRKFNRICTDVSFWRVKVKQDYGIEKKYGTTWKETAVSLFKVNMINLNNRWINGSTYVEMVKEIVKKKDSAGYMGRLQYEYYPEDISREVLFTGKIFIPNGDIQNDIINQMDRDLTNEEIETLKNVFTSEFAIIYRAFFEIERSYSIPLSREAYFDDTTQFGGHLAYILQPFIDVYPYIMLFSSLSSHELNNIIDYDF
uniref:F-box domain-containing protein n=1 Tax=Pithovirus LCPAC401 TaxID=2506595 RepID=A0A481ZA08_9VIRU|nr:MAG: uncharacterized protein LCPAC401_04010 [Pithovirus LCPAC401]